MPNTETPQPPKLQGDIEAQRITIRRLQARMRRARMDTPAQREAYRDMCEELDMLQSELRVMRADSAGR